MAICSAAGQPSANQGVDQLHVAVGARQPAGKLREIHDLGAGRTRHFLSDFPIVKRLDDDRFDVLRFHLLDHLREMRRRGRNARLRLEENVDVQTKTVREIRPRIVIGDDVLPLEWQHGGAPFL